MAATELSSAEQTQLAAAARRNVPLPLLEVRIRALEAIACLAREGGAGAGSSDAGGASRAGEREDAALDVLLAAVETQEQVAFLVEHQCPAALASVLLRLPPAPRQTRENALRVLAKLCDSPLGLNPPAKLVSDVSAASAAAVAVVSACAGEAPDAAMLLLASKVWAFPINLVERSVWRSAFVRTGAPLRLGEVLSRSTHGETVVACARLIHSFACYDGDSLEGDAPPHFVPDYALLLHQASDALRNMLRIAEAGTEPRELMEAALVAPIQVLEGILCTLDAPGVGVDAAACPLVRDGTLPELLLRALLTYDGQPLAALAHLHTAPRAAPPSESDRKGKRKASELDALDPFDEWGRRTPAEWAASVLCSLLACSAQQELLAAITSTPGAVDVLAQMEASERNESAVMSAEEILNHVVPERAAAVAAQLAARTDAARGSPSNAAADRVAGLAAAADAAAAELADASVSAPALDALTSMGFHASDAERALQVTRGNVQAAVNILLVS